MKKINKRGFTLVEMMLVIAIIVILASVAAIGIGDTLQRYRNTQNKYKDNYIPAVDQAQLRVQRLITTTRPNRVPPTVPPRRGTTSTPTPEPTRDPANTPTNTPTPGPTNTPRPTPTTRPTNTPRPTTPPEGEPVDLGNGIELSNGMYSSPAGTGPRVLGASVSGDTTNITVTDNNGWNSLNISITQDGGNAVLDLGGSAWAFSELPGFSWSSSTYTLNAEQKTWLANRYGITIN